MIIASGHGPGDVAKHLYCALLIGAAAICLARGLAPGDRLVWIALGTGQLLSAAGDLYWLNVLADDPAPTIPSVADVGWAAWYPFAAFALVRLLRRKFPGTRPTQWLDGVICALGIAAILSALLAPVVDQSILTVTLASTITTALHPLGNLLLVALCVGGLAVSGWRPGRAWLLLSVGVLVAAAGDALYTWGIAEGTYAPGGWNDFLFPLSSAFLAWAAWTPALQRAQDAGRRELVASVAVSFASIGVLATDHWYALHPLAISLASVTLVAAIVRTWLTFSDYVDLLEGSRRDAHTDALTGLANRRVLIADLERAIALPESGSPRALVLLDLNGFKAYNDTLGHAAGDALLVSVGARLRAAVRPDERPFRMGGDEFCVILTADERGLPGRVEALREACTHAEGGLHVTTAAGAVLLPLEAATPDAALRLADERMYAHKAAGHENGREAAAAA